MIASKHSQIQRLRHYANVMKYFDWKADFVKLFIASTMEKRSFAHDHLLLKTKATEAHHCNKYAIICLCKFDYSKRNIDSAHFEHLYEE